MYIKKINIKIVGAYKQKGGSHESGKHQWHKR